MKLKHPGYIDGHLDCRCWKTGDFVQVPCPWHDGKDKYPIGAYAQWLRAHAREFIETEEQQKALRRVLDWWKQDSAWGMGMKVKAPEPPTGPGANDPQELSVTPIPSSKQPRYNALGVCYGLNAKAKRTAGRPFLNPEKADPCIGFVDEDGQHDCGKSTQRRENAKRCAVCRVKARLAAQRVRRAGARLAVVDGAVMEISGRGSDSATEGQRKG